MVFCISMTDLNAARTPLKEAPPRVALTLVHRSLALRLTQRVVRFRVRLSQRFRLGHRPFFFQQKLSSAPARSADYGTLRMLHEHGARPSRNGETSEDPSNPSGFSLRRLSREGAEGRSQSLGQSRDVKIRRSRPEIQTLTPELSQYPPAQVTADREITIRYSGSASPGTLTVFRYRNPAFS
jgi:hypothetical protein